jgi:hypothetical protein
MIGSFISGASALPIHRRTLHEMPHQWTPWLTSVTGRPKQMPLQIDCADVVPMHLGSKEWQSHIVVPAMRHHKVFVFVEGQ